MEGRHHRSIWISDIHLGTRECRADALLDFLRHNESDHLYLVGDIIDGWRLTKSWYWAQSHNDVIQKLLRKARKGTRVFYIPGNHDHGLRGYAELEMGGVKLSRDLIHKTRDGRRMLVLHGDAFDHHIRLSYWRQQLADWGYDRLLTLNHLCNRVRGGFGYPYWSVSRFLKGCMREAARYVNAYEHAAAAEAKRRGVDGIICGHIHTPAAREIDGVLYLNDGDWVESCTAVVEDQDGRLDLINWAAQHDRSRLAAGAAADRAEKEADAALAHSFHATATVHD